MAAPSDRSRQPENRKRSGRAKAKRRRQPNSGSWKPGKSGNPGGRPTAVKEVQELASTFTEEAVRALVDTMRRTQLAKTWDPKETRQAAVAIINRACGMPSQPITGEGGKPFETGFPTFLAALRKLSGEDVDPAFAIPPPPAAATPAPAPAEGEPPSEG